MRNGPGIRANRRGIPPDSAGGNRLADRVISRDVARCAGDREKRRRRKRH